MPSYMCGSTRISLSVADLEKSTTASPVNKVGPEFASFCQTAADELKKDVAKRTLSETPVNTEEPWPSHLRFLGANQDMPFLMVQARHDLLNPVNSRRSSYGLSLSSMAERSHLDRSPSVSGTSVSSLSTLESTAVIGPEDEISLLVPSDGAAGTNSLQHPCQNMDNGKGAGKQREHGMETLDEVSLTSPDANPITAQGQEMGPDLHQPVTPNLNVVSDSKQTLCPEMKPQALCLTVQLSKKSFLRQPKTKPLDLKIDIYLNGEFCSCSYVPERTCLDSNLANLAQRFAGRRIERLLERPWIIVPPGQSPDGSLREYGRSEEGAVNGVLQRWSAIADLLREEAEKGGRNKWGDLFVLGDYLNSLSKLEMPKEVEILQRAEGPKFGVLDVVLTTGHGKKFQPGHGYLLEPIAMTTSELTVSKEGPQYLSPVSVPEIQIPKPNIMQRVKSTADTEIIAGGLRYCTPRERDVSEPQRFQGSRDLDGTDPVSASTPKSIFRPPNIPSAAPSAGRRRRSGTTRTTSREQPTSVATAIPADESVTSRLITSSQSTFAVPTSSGSLTAPQSPAPVLSPEQLATPSSELPTRKRRRPVAPGPNTPQMPSSSHLPRVRHSQQVLRDSRNRIHSPSGRFTKGSNQLTPGKPISNKPANIPQKRYKGQDAPTVFTENVDEEAERQRRRSRMRGELVLTNKMTLAEEMAAIQEQAREELAPDPKPKSCANGNTTNSQQETITLCSGQSRKGGQPPVPWPLSAGTKPLLLDVPLTAPATFPDSLPSSCTQSMDPPPTPSSSLAPHSTLADQPATTAHPTSSPAPPTTPANPNSSIPPVPSTLPTGPRARSRRNAATEHPPSTWQPTALHDDCVVTYAPDKVRQIRSERPGWFREVGVLVGVRFLIG